MSTADDQLLDPNVLRELIEFRVPGEPDPVADVVELFLEVTPGRLRELVQAAEAHRHRDVRDIAHTLKGSAGTVGASAMRATAAEVEEAAEASSDDSIALARQLAELFEQTKPALQSLVVEMSAE